jgi:hypothetical protein
MKLREIAAHLRTVAKPKKPISIYAHNGIGKTRLSGEFKDIAKQSGEPDTLYFNAFTEDLFSWDNDTENDTRRVLRMNKNSQFFAGIKEQDMENKIRPLLSRYADFDFLIDYDEWEVNFIREIIVDGSPENIEFIKISRGEENIFIWCFFLAVAELAVERQIDYQWVKNIYVDDPISSLDENNTIEVACHLAQLMKTPDNIINFIISTHHSLFFNVIFNEFGSNRITSIYLHRNGIDNYRIVNTNDTPHFHHIAMLNELKEAANSSNIKPYHFNVLRSTMEKTSSFMGLNGFADCIDESPDKNVFKRSLNTFSHGKYAVYDPADINDDTKEVFKRILDDFLTKYGFNSPLIELSLTTEQA